MFQNPQATQEEYIDPIPSEASTHDGSATKINGLPPGKPTFMCKKPPWM